MNFMKLRPLFNRQLFNATNLTRAAFSSSTSSATTGGISFQITDEQKSLFDLAERFAREEIIPKAPHHDRTGEYPWEIIRKAHDLGLTLGGVPEKYGGLGLSLLSICMIGEKLAYGCTGVVTAMSSNELGQSPLLLFGNEGKL